MKRIVLVVALLSVLASQAVSQTTQTPRRIAFTVVNNLSADPRIDYLGGIVQGLLMYDLSRTAGVTLVDRASLDRVLAELELQLSGVVDDKSSAVKVGTLLGADFLVSAEFVALSGEALVTVKSVEVATGRVVTYVEHGGTENAVHRLAEALAEYYTGVRPAFVNVASERSILTMRDESPGTIALFSIMQHAEIFFDGEFAGYTTGNSEVPYEFKGVRPGTHTVRVRVGHGFGIVKLPEVTFAEWEAVIVVQPGKRHVVRDETRDFNSILYRLQNLSDKDFYYEKGKPGMPLVSEATFSDRTGAAITASLSLNPTDQGTTVTFKPTLKVNGVTAEWSVTGKPGEIVESERIVGVVKAKVSIDMRYGKMYVQSGMTRTDVYQNMYDE